MSHNQQSKKLPDANKLSGIRSRLQIIRLSRPKKNKTLDHPLLLSKVKWSTLKIILFPSFQMYRASLNRVTEKLVEAWENEKCCGNTTRQVRVFLTAFLSVSTETRQKQGEHHFCISFRKCRDKKDFLTTCLL